MFVRLTLLDHFRASSCSCLAATIIGSLTISPAFCSGNSSSFSSGGGGLGGGTSPSGSGGFGGACSSFTWHKGQKCCLLISFCNIYKNFATLMTWVRTLTWSWSKSGGGGGKSGSWGWKASLTFPTADRILYAESRKLFCKPAQEKQDILFASGTTSRVNMFHKTCYQSSSPGCWMFPATALASITMGEIVLLSSSEAAFTISLNLGSSEFSTSLLATRSIRLARLAMLVAPATSIWGWTFAIATRHLSMSFLMASSEASRSDLVSIASSTKPATAKKKNL